MGSLYRGGREAASPLLFSPPRGRPRQSPAAGRTVGAPSPPPPTAAPHSRAGSARAPSVQGRTPPPPWPPPRENRPHSREPDTHASPSQRGLTRMRISRSSPLPPPSRHTASHVVPAPHARVGSRRSLIGCRRGPARRRARGRCRLRRAEARSRCRAAVTAATAARGARRGTGHGARGAAGDGCLGEGLIILGRLPGRRGALFFLTGPVTETRRHWNHQLAPVSEQPRPLDGAFASWPLVLQSKRGSSPCLRGDRRLVASSFVLKEQQHV